MKLTNTTNVITIGIELYSGQSGRFVKKGRTWIAFYGREKNLVTGLKMWQEILTAVAPRMDEVVFAGVPCNG